MLLAEPKPEDPGRKNKEGKDALLETIAESTCGFIVRRERGSSFYYQEIDDITTPQNSNAIFSINLDPSKHVIAYLTKNTGEIMIKTYAKIDIENQGIQNQRPSVPQPTHLRKKHRHSFQQIYSFEKSRHLMGNNTSFNFFLPRSSSTSYSPEFAM